MDNFNQIKGSIGNPYTYDEFTNLNNTGNWNGGFVQVSEDIICFYFSNGERINSDEGCDDLELSFDWGSDIEDWLMTMNNNGASGSEYNGNDAGSGSGSNIPPDGYATSPDRFIYIPRRSFFISLYGLHASICIGIIISAGCFDTLEHGYSSTIHVYVVEVKALDPDVNISNVNISLIRLISPETMHIILEYYCSDMFEPQVINTFFS